MTTRDILCAVANAYRHFRASFSYQKSSDELFDAFCDSLTQELGEYEIVYDFLCGKDTVNVDGITKGYFVQPGDTVLMDISVGKDGVWCDVCRTYFVGGITEEQRRRFEMIRSSLRAGERALRAGAVARDIYGAVNAVYEQQGETLIHHAGHRIGSAPLLQPQFLSENDTALLAGETYTVESGLYRDFGIRLENDFLLTNNKAADLFEDLLPLCVEEYILK